MRSDPIASIRSAWGTDAERSPAASRRSVGERGDGRAAVDVVADASHPGELALVHGPLGQRLAGLAHVLPVGGAAERHVHGRLRQREAVAVAGARHALARRHLPRVDQRSPTCRSVGADRGARVTRGQLREDVVLGAAVRRVVAHHEEVEDALARHLGEERAPVARQHQVAHAALLAQREGLVEDRLGRALVVPAEQQHVGVVEAQAAESSEDGAADQGRRPARIALEHDGDSVPVAPGEAPDSLAEAGPPDAAPVEVVDAVVVGVLEIRGVDAEARAQPDAADLEVRVREHDARLPVHAESEPQARGAFHPARAARAGLRCGTYHGRPPTVRERRPRMPKRTLRTPLCDLLENRVPDPERRHGTEPDRGEDGRSRRAGGGRLGGGRTRCARRARATPSRGCATPSARSASSRAVPSASTSCCPAATVAAGDAPAESAREIPLSDALNALPAAHREWLLKIKDELELPDSDAVISGGTTTSRPHAAVEVCIEEGVPLFCAGLGNPGLHGRGRARHRHEGAGHRGQREERRSRIARGGADLVVAQGHEAGGHTGRIGSMALWPQAIDAAAPTPVAGGRRHRRRPRPGCRARHGLRRRLGRDALPGVAGRRRARHPEAGDRQRRATRTPAAPRSTPARRRVRPTTGFHDLWDESGLEPLRFPMQVVLASAIVDMFNRAGNVEYVGPFAGQVAGLIDEVKPAAQIVEEMVEEAADILTRRLPESVRVR